MFDAEKPLTFYVAPRRSIQFLNVAGKVIGILDWTDGPMKFSGNAEESAKLFFDFVSKLYGENHDRR